tara:strand:- start:1591 stop:2619 length:1029 start_codon:yes stop_codon:yes gene_type:complete
MKKNKEKAMINAYASHQPGEPLQPFRYKPGPLNVDEVEISVDYCGICHSDLSMIDNAWGMTTYPLVPGHEVIGKINNVGQDVTELSIGDTVGLGWHAGYCSTCASCLAGHYNLCQNATASIVGHHGGFADYVRAKANSVFILPDRLDQQSAGPLFCGGITVFNPLITFSVKPTDRVAVIGVGGLGHLACQFLNAWGCEVTAFTSTPNKKTVLKKLGVHRIIDSTDSEAIEQVAGQFDFILSTVNVKLDWNHYLGALKPNGRLHIVGGVLEPLDLSAFALIMGQRQVSGSPVGPPSNIRKMLDFCALHKIKPVIETFAMKDVNQALNHLRAGKARYRIVLTNK